MRRLISVTLNPQAGRLTPSLVFTYLPTYLHALSYPQGRFVLDRPLTGMMSFASGAIYSGAFGPDSKPAGEVCMQILTYAVSIRTCILLTYLPTYLPTQQGFMRFPNGAIYEGTFHAGLPGSSRVHHNVRNGSTVTIPTVGHGIMRFTGSGLYSGEWKEGKQHGTGLLRICPSSATTTTSSSSSLLLRTKGNSSSSKKRWTVYIGGWYAGKMEGRGRLYQVCR